MFSRTSSGIRNTDLFYRNQYLVVVEGQDDVPFWGLFFPKEIDGYECKFKPVGGSEIKNYIDEVCKNNAKFAVALDSDYRLFVGKIYNHNQILETLLYSIENIIISPQTLAEIIRIESRKGDYDVDNVKAWFEHFDEAMYDLMVADYLIQKECLGKEGLGKSCLRFLENQKTRMPIFDFNKIENFIKTLDLFEDLFKVTKEELKSYKPSQHIRGHFFFGASLCFLNHEVNKLRPNKVKRSIANDDLYTMLVLSCKNSFSTCPELKDLHKRAGQVAREVIKLLTIREV